MPIFVKQTIADFIDFCSKKYNNFYDYSLIEKEYTEVKFNLSVKINIICPIHGIFNQRASSHKYKHGCAECGKIRTHFSTKKDKDWFIEKAEKVHGNSFTYIGDYFNSYTKIDIKCNTCQTVFSQSPASHLQGVGCKKCKIKINAIKISSRKRKYKKISKYTNESFKEAYLKKFGNKYDLSKINIESLKSKIIIGCFIHGDFLINAESFLSGSGCQKCAREKINKAKIKNREYFIKKANKIHNNKYLYHNTIYKGLFNKVDIECPVHGTFKQRPCDHYKSGCPLCGLEKIGTASRLSKYVFLDRLIDLYGDKYDLSKLNYENYNSSSIIICDEHGDVEVSNKSLMMGKGCPRCTGSSCEKLIDTYLTELDIKFIREYRVSGYRYRWDFYLPEYKIFIEYHGQQHYHAIDVFGGKSSLEITKRRDEHKEQIVTKELGNKLIILNYLDKENNNLKINLINKLIEVGVEINIDYEDGSDNLLEEVLG